MFFIFCLQVYFVLVSSNPLYDYNICPITYPNYRNGEQLLIHSSDNNPYLQKVLVHNQLTPNIPNNILPQQLLNLLIPNYQYNYQNGVDVTKQISEPFETQKIINNYILVPEEYFTNDGNEDSKVRERKNDSHLKSNRRRRNKKQRQSTSSNKYIEKENQNNKETIMELKPENISEDKIESTKSKRKKCKKKRERNQIKSTNSEVLEEEKNTENGRRSKHVNSIKTILDENVTKSVPIPIKSETELFKVTTLESKPNKDETGFDDFHICFDINEDCTDLDCRHTRNKDVKTRNNNNRNNKPHSKPPPDLSNNYVNLMNSFTSNQQMNPNFFNSNANFPFNFDYLYQTPQTTSIKPKESGTRRRNRKRKQPTNRQPNSNRRVKELKTTTESCAQVVELVPETTEIDISTIATTTTEIVEELKSTSIVEKPQNVLQEESNLDNYKPDIEKPMIIDHETVDKEKVKNDINIILFENYNDIMDEYYPDFTSDKSYVSSKEDYELDNFHDRHYYYYGDNTELNRNRRKYEHQKENEIHQNRKVNRNNEINVLNTPDQYPKGHKYDIPRKSVTSIEKKQHFSPSATEFPGFKTEMINKDQYFAKEGEYEKDDNIFTRNKMPSYSDLMENNQANEYHNNVEMVFANSKVVKYGTPEHEVTTELPQPEYKNKNKKNISDDSKTIVIFAKSLDYT